MKLGYMSSCREYSLGPRSVAVQVNRDNENSQSITLFKLSFTTEVTYPTPSPARVSHELISLGAPSAPRSEPLSVEPSSDTSHSRSVVDAPSPSPVFAPIRVTLITNWVFPDSKAGLVTNSFFCRSWFKVLGVSFPLISTSFFHLSFAPISRYRLPDWKRHFVPHSPDRDGHFRAHFHYPQGDDV